VLAGVSDMWEGSVFRDNRRFYTIWWEFG